MTQRMRSTRRERWSSCCLAAVVLVACGSDAAWAGRLDKAACEALGKEYVAAEATGIGGEIARGPDWARANLQSDRLQSILRFIEIEQQLEFRCGRSAIAKAREKSKSPAKEEAPAVEPPATGASQTAVVPPAGKSATDTAQRPPPAAVVIKPPVSEKSLTPPPAAQPAPPRTTPPAAVVIKPPVATNPAPAAATTPKTVPSAQPPAKSAPAGKPAAIDATAAVAPAIAVPAAQAPAAAPKIPPAPSASASKNVDSAAPGGDAEAGEPVRKKSRRTPSNAYVSPNEVNPYSIPGFGGR